MAIFEGLNLKGMKQYDTLLTVIEDNIMVVTINRPEALNALNDQVFKDLIQLFTNDLKSTDLKGIVIIGAGDRAFVAGADIKEFASLDESAAASLSKRGHDIFQFIENMNIPVIAAVNGFALGGGCELAMACHLRIASEHAKFGLPEVNIGIIPGYGGTQRLPRLVGRGKALELMMTTEMIGADQAVQLGLANQKVNAGEEVNAAKKLIEKISAKAPLAIAEIIKTVNNYYDSSVDGFMSETNAFGKLAATNDFKEGVSAFIEKRKASFTKS